MAKDIKFNVKLNVDGKDHVVKVTQDAKDLKKTFENVAGAIAGVSGNMIALNQSFEAFGKLHEGLSKLTEESRNFSGAMAAANTMAGKAGEDFEKMRDAVSELSKDVPVARDALADGLYQVVSNGVPEDNWIGYLRDSARASVGGIADLGEVVKVTSTVIKNYGLDWADAGAIQDKIQLTAKNGVTSFEQLAGALPAVTGNAATLGVEIEELLASFATLTGVSGNTNEVATQMGAIFTALVKPSSEAANMAAEMGIQFDAAAIKASGGLQNFLASLSQSVSAYAASSGTLEQEIYGRLFGSAEALRAIGPLVGNLSDTFNANIRNMADSAGTMDAAFNQMANTGSSWMQKVANEANALFDFVNPVFDMLQAASSAIAPMGQLFMSVYFVGKSFTSLAGAVRASTIATNLHATASKAFKPVLVTLHATMQVLSAKLRGTAVSATAAKVAIRGLMISTGVGAAVAILAFAFEKLAGKADEATESVKQVDEATQAYRDTVSRVEGEMRLEAAELRRLMNAHEDTSEAVAGLNAKYGEAFGHHKSASEWYDILIRKSKAYARQLGLEAHAKLLSSKIVALELEQEANDKQKEALEKAGKATTHRKELVLEGNSIAGAYSIGTGKYYTAYDYPEYKAALDEGNRIKEELRKLNSDLGSITERMVENAKDLGSGLNKPKPKPQAVTAPTKEVQKEVEKAKPVYVPTRLDLKGIRENIQALEKQLEENARLDTPEYNNTLKALIAKERQKEAEILGTLEKKTEETTKAEEKAGAVYRENATTLAEIEENIRALNEQLGEAKTTEEAANINRMTQVWEQQAEALRNAGRESQSTYDNLREGWDTVKGFAGGIDQLTSAFKGNQKGFAAFTAAVDGLLSIIDNAQKASQLFGVFGKMGEVGKGIAGTLAGNSAEAAKTASAAAAATATTSLSASQGAAIATTTVLVAANKAATQSYVQLASAMYLAAHAYIPFAGFGIGSGFAASAVALIESIGAMPFAKGGIVSGPTLAMVGEYGGARNNPEVIAPLDKLRHLLADGNSGGPGRVEFRIREQSLRGILKQGGRRLSRI